MTESGATGLAVRALDEIVVRNSQFDANSENGLYFEPLGSEATLSFVTTNNNQETGFVIDGVPTLNFNDLTHIGNGQGGQVGHDRGPPGTNLVDTWNYLLTTGNAEDFARLEPTTIDHHRLFHRTDELRRKVHRNLSGSALQFQEIPL